MEEKKEIKVKLSTAICLFIILVLLTAGIVYYLGFIRGKEKNVKDKNEMQITNIVNNDNNEKIDTKNNVPKSDLVVSTNDLYAYIEDGILYYTEEVSKGTFSKDEMIKDTQLSNIKRMKLYNIGVEVNPVLFLITEDGEVHTMRYYFSKEIEKYEGLKDFKVEDILNHTGEMYDVFEVLLKDGTHTTVNVYESIEVWEKANGYGEVDQNKKIDPNRHIVYTKYSKHSSEYSIELPKININSQDVAAINTEIEKIIEGVETEIQEGTGVYNRIDYRDFIDGEVLSVVIKKYSDNDDVDYTVYNVSVKTGKRFTNEELIALKGFTLDEFLNKLPELHKKQYMAGLVAEEQLNSSRYSVPYNKTISKDNYGINNSMFLDYNGNLNIVANIYRMDGEEAPHSEIIIVK